MKNSATHPSAKTIYRLPDGRETHLRECYVDAWEELAREVAAALDCTATGWSPDIYLETNQGVRFQVPLCVALKVVELEARRIAPWYLGEEIPV